MIIPIKELITSITNRLKGYFVPGEIYYFMDEMMIDSDDVVFGELKIIAVNREEFKFLGGHDGYAQYASEEPDEIHKFSDCDKEFYKKSKYN
jgi:hypothetical protein